MKIESHVKVFGKKVRNGEETYSISLFGEMLEEDERLGTMNLTLNNIPRQAIGQIGEQLGVGNIEQAALASFPMDVEITTPQRRLDDVE